MTRVALENQVPGIGGLFTRFPRTGVVLRQLADALLVDPAGALPLKDRELIATYVSRRNGCEFCSRSHGAVTAQRDPGYADVVERILSSDAAGAVDAVDGLDERLLALLQLADETRSGGREVRDETVAAARRAGASDEAIHDTVLIAAAFSMFNRYVDGLQAPLPAPEGYLERAEAICANGYSVRAQPTS